MDFFSRALRMSEMRYFAIAKMKKNNRRRGGGRLGILGGLGGRSVTLTVIVAVAAISALFLKLKARGPKIKKQNSELGKDSGGMMMINNCKITRSQDQGRPTVLAGGMSIIRGVP